MEYGYQGLDPGSKVWYLLNGIRCDKMSKAVATVRAHPGKYEKDFDAVVAFLTQYIDKRSPTQGVKVAFVGQTRPTQAAEDQHYLWHFQRKGWVEERLKKDRLVKGKKTPESSRALYSVSAMLEGK